MVDPTSRLCFCFIGMSAMGLAIGGAVGLSIDGAVLTRVDVTISFSGLFLW